MAIREACSSKTKPHLDECFSERQGRGISCWWAIQKESFMLGMGTFAWGPRCKAQDASYISYSSLLGVHQVVEAGRCAHAGCC
jgi:hypothetical protein